MNDPPIQQLRRLKGGHRAADWLVGHADIRNRAFSSRFLRRLRLAGDSPLAAYWFTGNTNFGDAVTPYILQQVTGVTPVFVSHVHEGKILAVGSNLNNRVKPKDIIWGTGAMFEEPVHLDESVRVLAVRGPLTHRLLRGVDAPEVYGDPALLLPGMYRPTPSSRRYDVGVVPHFVDQTRMQVSDTSIRWIDVLRPWWEVVDAITSCSLIVSSSLHGLIVAEAYGIPAVWVTASAHVKGGSFKFRDYYASTEREGPAVGIDWRKGLAAIVKKPAPPIRFDPRPLQEAGGWILSEADCS